MSSDLYFIAAGKKITYTIAVTTGTQSRPGNSDGPGTRAKIKVKLFGTSTKTNKKDQTDALKLSKGSKWSIINHKFQPGK